MGLTITAFDGEHFWNLTTGYEGVKILGGMDGALDPPFQGWWSERLGDGDRWRGTRLTRRVITMRIKVGLGVPGMAWRELDRAWWDTINRNDATFLEVRLEDLTRRYTTVRLERHTQTAIDFDPALTGYQLYMVSLVAEDPYWLGDDIVEQWSFAPGAENFYGGSGGGGLGPPYVLSASGGFGTADVTNPGDVPAWPRWEVSGPTTAAMLTVDGHSIALPAGVPGGHSRYIITDPPNVYGSFLEPRWNEMTGAKDFYPVPTGATVPVTASLTSPDTGAFVKMTITPRYERPW